MPEAQYNRLRVIGANALDGYHLVTQLLCFYTDIVKVEEKSDAKKLWTSSEDSLLIDVGDAYQFWNNIIDEANYGIITPESKEINDLTLTLRKRLDQLLNAVNGNVEAKRFPSVLMKCEKRWFSLIGHYKDTYPAQSVVLGKLMDRCETRMMNLSKLARIHGQKIIDVRRIMNEYRMQSKANMEKKAVDLLEEEIG